MRTAFILTLSLTLLAHAGEGYDCEDSPYLKSTEMSCVACAVEEVTGHAPSEKYLMLLAYATQRFVPNTRYLSPRYSNDDQGHSQNPELPKAQKEFYRHIAEIIQSYGVCFEQSLDRNGQINPAAMGYGNLRSNQFDPRITGALPQLANGTLKAEDLGPTGPSIIAENFGFGSDAQLAKLFAVPGWTPRGPAGRRDYFNQVISGSLGSPLGMSSTPHGMMLRNCLDQMRALQERAPKFRLGSPGSVGLCKAVADSCGTGGSNFCIAPEAPRGGAGGSLFAPDADDGPVVQPRRRPGPAVPNDEDQAPPDGEQ